MKLAARAKLNLMLRVLGRQRDGYHAIESLFVRLSLADELDVELAGSGIAFRATGEFPVPLDATNLCVRAAELWHEAAGRRPACSIDLDKRIPVAAGLGGGSADAAAVLMGLNRLHGEPLDAAGVIRLAGSLGSDVPFFVTGADLALGWERGRRILPLSAAPRRPVIVLVPDFGVRAADAYEWWGADREAGEREVPGFPGAAALPAAAALSDWTSLERVAVNDLEAPVGRRHPSIPPAAAALSEHGAATSLLCGSGSCVAGIFDEPGRRDAAAGHLRADPRIPASWGLITTWTEGSGPTPPA